MSIVQTYGLSAMQSSLGILTIYNPSNAMIELWDLTVPGALLLSIILIAIYFVRVRIR